MKNYPGYLDLFISPVSGLINISGKQSIAPNYTWIGNRNNVAIESPILIDIRLDLIQIRKKLGTTPFVLQTATQGFDNSQALDEVPNGLIMNADGFIVPASLTHNYFWIGDENNRPVESNKFPIGALPDLLFQNIWIGDNTNRPVPNQRIGNINLPPFTTDNVSVNLGIYNLYTGGTVNVANFMGDPGPVASTTLRVDPSNLPNLSKGKIWIGVVNSTQPTISIDTTPPYFHVTAGSLNWDALGASDDSHGIPAEIGLNANQLFVGNSDNSGQITATVILNIANMANLTNNKFWVGNSSNRPVESDTLPESGLPDLTYKNIWVGNTSNRPVAQIILYIDNMANLSTGKLWTGDSGNRPIETQTITIDNFPDLTSGNIWRGDSMNRPEESPDLSNLENRVTDLETRVTSLETRVTAVEADIVAIHTELAAIQAELIVIAGEIAALQTQVTALEVAVTILQGQVITLFAQIAALDAYVKSITLSTFVIGGPPDPTTGVIVTSRGPTCLLTNIPAGGNVDLGNYRIFDLATFNPTDWYDMEAKQLDAINFLFLWNFFGGGTR